MAAMRSVARGPRRDLFLGGNLEWVVVDLVARLVFDNIALLSSLRCIDIAESLKNCTLIQRTRVP
jgi:hypothetical protein